MAAAPPIAALWKKLEANQPEEVLEAMDGASNLSPAHQTLLALANFEAGQFEQAASQLQAILKDAPENPIAQLFLVLALFQAGEPKQAGEHLLSKTTVLPHRLWLEHFVRIFWPLRFTTTLGAPQPLPADWQDPYESAYQKWLTIRETVTPPKDESASPIGELIHVLSLIMSESGRQTLFVRRLGERYESRAEKTYHGGNREQAEMFMGRAREIYPAKEAILTNLAFIQLTLNRREEALAFLEEDFRAREEALAGGEKRDLPGMMLTACYGWALHENGRHEEALRALASVRPEGPEDLGAHFYAAVSWLMLGRTEEFRAAFAVASSAYFIDTWEQILRPFIGQAAQWMADGAK